MTVFGLLFIACCFCGAENAGWLGGLGLCCLDDEDGGSEFFDGEEHGEAAVDVVSGEVDADGGARIEAGASGMDCAPVAGGVPLETAMDD